MGVSAWLSQRSNAQELFVCRGGHPLEKVKGLHFSCDFHRFCFQKSQAGLLHKRMGVVQPLPSLQKRCPVKQGQNIQSPAWLTFMTYQRVNSILSRFLQMVRADSMVPNTSQRPQRPAERLSVDASCSWFLEINHPIEWEGDQCGPPCLYRSCRPDCRQHSTLKRSSGGHICSDVVGKRWELGPYACGLCGPADATWWPSHQWRRWRSFRFMRQEKKFSLTQTHFEQPLKSIHLLHACPLSYCQ